MTRVPTHNGVRGLLCLSVLAAAAWCSADEPARQAWTIDGVSREALIYAPARAKTVATPIVFAFHGHGGSMRNAARSFAYHTHWPEAIAVYMQGLNTPGRLTDPEGKRPGWQHGLGDRDDRDLKFFDAVLESLKRDFRVDEKRVFATGHSNGGGFTYLLWAARGERFAALAPSAAVGVNVVRQLKAKPVLHVAGESDPLVKFAWQQRMIDALQRLNACGDGAPWGQNQWCTVYASKHGAPVVTCIHPGDHKFPAEAPPLIVKFFKEQTLP